MTDSRSHPSPSAESVNISSSSDFPSQRRGVNSMSTSSEPGSSSHTPARSSRTSRKNRHLVVPADTVLTFSSYHPPVNDDGPSVVRTSNSKRGPTRSTPRPREQFVQSNYRFAVDPSAAAALRPSQLFADAHVPWDIVDLVFVPHESDCPICLHPLSCPRLTPCGHVFDYVCMLQLFAHDSADARHSRCPLCAQRITANVLKPCAFTTSVTPVLGSRMALRLISRLRGSMLCFPYSVPPAPDEVPIVTSAAVPLYTRFAYADRAFLLGLISKSVEDLHTTLHEDPSLSPFVSTALSSLKEWKNALRARPNLTYPTQSIVAGNTNTDKSHEKFSIHCMALPQDLRTEDSSGRSSYEGQETQAEVDTSTESTLQTPGFTGKSRWYFYQDSNSGNVFLHPVNHRCLTTEFGGNFDAALNVVDGEVLQTDRYIMDEQLRRRYRFLEHLPIGCEFMFVELNLSRFLSESTLETHKAELKDRKSARKRKEIAYVKETKRMEREQSKSLREYFNTQGGMVRGVSPLRQSVDRNDLVSFPALTEDAHEASSALMPNNDVSTETDIAAVAEPEPSDPGRGAEVSSYSSVTSNMGLFPALGSSPQSASILQGAWGPSSQASSPKTDRTGCSGSSHAVESRRGRKSHGKTTILLSNAGSQARR